MSIQFAYCNVHINRKLFVCGKMNHFSTVCRGKPNNRSKSLHPKKTSRGKYHVRSADVEVSPSSEMSSLAGVDSDNSEEYTFNIGAQGHEAGKPIFQVTIMNTPIRIMADSGATVNILGKRDFDGLKSKPQLVETSAKVYPYMSDKPLTLCGKFRATVTSGSCSSVETFYVAKGSSSSILSWTISQALDLIKAVSTVEPPVSLPPDAQDFLKEFPNLTSGMDKYKGEPARIHIDESVKPVAQPDRRAPLHVRKQVEEKLKQLENHDIIERVEGPTPWVSPIVVVPKPNKPNEINRICVDMRSLNKAIIRERHIIPYPASRTSVMTSMLGAQTKTLMTDI